MRYSPSALALNDPVQSGGMVQTIAAGDGNGPYSAAFTVTVSPARPVTSTRSKIVVPGAVVGALTIVCTAGCVSTSNRSAGSSQGVVRPTCPSSDGTTSW